MLRCRLPPQRGYVSKTLRTRSGRVRCTYAKRSRKSEAFNDIQAMRLRRRVMQRDGPCAGSLDRDVHRRVGSTDPPRVTHPRRGARMGVCARNCPESSGSDQSKPSMKMRSRR